MSKTGSKPKAAKPIMTDAGIAAKTGHGWDYWFAALDKAGAAKLDHKGITALLDKKFKPGPWWGQMIAVSYERARGIRAMNQKCDGEFSVSVTKVMPVGLSQLFDVVTDETSRKKWFPPGAFEETSRTRDKYWRGKWKTDARLSAGFYAKGDGKAQIAMDIGKLADADAVETERAAWKKALEKLQGLLSA
ncbi:MAG TPA: hypothetical protein VNU97_06870 [Rhizomicrobium sp.]|jgi:hypothetical protein|nr:hypothetical protein [Rhizomicrobium sp.]